MSKATKDKTGDSSPENTEFRVSDVKPKMGYFNGPGIVNKKVEYVDIDGFAIAEGDVCLGPVSEVEKESQEEKLVLHEQEAAREALEFADDIDKQEAAVITAGTNNQYRWPNCVVPYEIDPNLPRQERVNDAMKHWREKTGIRFVNRTNHSDYLFFSDKGGCWSFIGRRGGKQNVSIGSGCSTGNTIHEIGHALGMYHEQSRLDRNNFVKINYQNITPGREGNFNQYLTGAGMDVGTYDYCSIMHYPAFAFSKNNLPTIEALQPVVGCTLGQRSGLSNKDISAMRKVYGCYTDSCDRFRKLANRYNRYYRLTRRKHYRCYYYYYVAAYYRCKYTSTKQRKYQCAYYYNLSKYNCCLYSIRRIRRYYYLCRRYRSLYNLCVRARPVRLYPMPPLTRLVATRAVPNPFPLGRDI